MRNKFKSAIIIVFLITTLVNITLAQHSKSLYNIIAGWDGFSSFDGKNYISIQVYLNNNSNDTLYYQGADCNNLLFSIKNNPYFHLPNDICRQSEYFKTAIAPHRAQKMELYLTMDRTPDRDVSIRVNMNLYKWTSDRSKQSKDSLLGNLSNSTVLHYNISHQAYWPKDEFKILKKKERSVLPDKDIYLLTDNDRRLYTLSIDEKGISSPCDTVRTAFKNNKLENVKVVIVPVSLHNNSNDTLIFYSMTCSWFEFWNTNRSDIRLFGWGCDKNIPELITVAPHQEYKKRLSITYNPRVKAGDQYQISMSLLKVSDYTKLAWDFEANENVRFNKIWTNKIAIK